MSIYGVSQLIFLKESDKVWIAEFYLLCNSPKEMMESASYKQNDIDSLNLIPNFVLYHAIYLLTPWCRVLLEKLTGLQLVKRFPAFHGIRRFITALTSVHHLSLSWASPIQSI